MVFGQYNPLHLIVFARAFYTKTRIRPAPEALATRPEATLGLPEAPPTCPETISSDKLSEMTRPEAISLRPEAIFLIQQVLATRPEAKICNPRTNFFDSTNGLAPSPDSFFKFRTKFLLSSCKIYEN